MANTKKVITKKAHEIAINDFKAANAKEFMLNTMADIESGNDVLKHNGLTRAAEFTNKLTLLILYQEIQSDGGLGAKYEWYKHFDDGTIEAGNSKEYIFEIPTGHENYESDLFVPNKKSLPKVDSKIISIYTRNAQGQAVLSQGAYQFRKPITIQANEWIPYFKAGNLSAFIEKLLNYMKECYKMMLVEIYHNIIKTLTPAKIINKTDTNIDTNNLFLAMVNDVIPTIEDMKYYNIDYNYDITRGGAHTTSAENLLIFSNHKIREYLQGGVMSRAFHSEMINPSAFVNNNWIGLNKSLVVPKDSNQAITTGQDVLDEQTIYIFDKRLIRHLRQVYEQGNQSYTSNMTIQHELHIWGVVDIIPWFKCVKYTNVNLNKQPN